MSDNGEGPKVVGEIRIALVTKGPGQSELQFNLGGNCQTDEILARGLWDKARDLMVQLFAQKQLQAAMTAIKPAPASALDALRRHDRG